jgi:hypothetical protein
VAAKGARCLRVNLKHGSPCLAGKLYALKYPAGMLPTMPIPDFQSVVLPLLKIAADGG